MRQLEEELLYSSTDWFEKIEREQTLSPINTIKFYNHFQHLKRMGYDLKMQEHHPEMNYLTLVRYDDKSEIMSTQYRKND